MGRQDYETETLIPTRGGFFDDVAHSLRAEGFDASEDGTGRGTPLVTAFEWQRGATQNLDMLKEQSPALIKSQTPAIAFSAKDHGGDAGDISPTLRGGGHHKSHANGGVMPAVAFDLRGREGGAQFEGPHDTANMRAASGGSSRSYVAHTAVRRLTPRECERLQGFPDDYTLIPLSRGQRKAVSAEMAAYYRRTNQELTDEQLTRLAADGPRYKALGNSMAVPVMRWIGERIELIETLTKRIG